MTMAIFLAMSPSRMAAMASPSRTTTPARSFSCRIMLFKMVDLPEPLGPMRVNISPRRTPISMSRIRGTPS